MASQTLTMLAVALEQRGVVTHAAPAAGSDIMKAARAWVARNTKLGVKMFKNLTATLSKHPKKVRAVFVIAALSILIVKLGPKLLARWVNQGVVTQAEFTDAQKLFARIVRNPDWYGDIPEATSAMIKRAVHTLSAAAESVAA